MKAKRETEDPLRRDVLGDRPDLDTLGRRRFTPVRLVHSLPIRPIERAGARRAANKPQTLLPTMTQRLIGTCNRFPASKKKIGVGFRKPNIVPGDYRHIGREFQESVRGHNM